MRVISKISIRNMARRKSRYILTTLTLIIGVALFGGVMIVSDSFQSTMLSSIDLQMGSADILFRTNNTYASSDGWFDPTELEDTLHQIDNIKGISYRISGQEISISGIDNGNQIENSTNCVIYGIDIDNPIEPELGGIPFIIDVIPEMTDATTIEELLTYRDSETNHQVILITESLQVQFGKTSGDTIRVLPMEGNDTDYEASDTSTWEEFTIVAVIRDSGEAQDFDPSTGELITLSQGITPVVFTDIDNAHLLVDGTVDRSGLFNLGVIDLNDMYQANQTALEIYTALNALDDDREWKVLDLKSSSIEEINTTMETMDIMFIIFGLVALILSTVLIINIFNIIREEQKYETGMFQAIGASKTETFKMFLIQGTIMGVIGAAFGTILSYFIADAIFSVTLNAMSGIAEGAGQTISIMDFSIKLVPSTIIITFLIGFSSCLIASIFPSYKAIRKPIIECLNPIEEQNERVKKKYLKFILYFLLGVGLVLIGAIIVVQLNAGMEFGPSQDGDGPPGFGGSDTAISMIAPVMILFGILIIATVFINPIVRVIIKLFSSYLKQTQLLTEKNILRHPRRTVLTFWLIALTTSYLIGMSVVMDSMRAGVNTTIDDTVGSDIQMYSFAPSSVKDDILNLDNVTQVLKSKMQNALIKVDDEWIGRDLLEGDYTESVNINIIDPIELELLIDDVKILSPNGIPTTQIVEELESGSKILITEEFSIEYEVEAGDSILVNFTLDSTFADVESMFTQNNSDVKVNYYALEMEVVAVVNKVQGFGLAAFIGGTGNIHQMFISWNTFTNQIASQSLPGQDTDLVVRKASQTGNVQLDSISSSWFNLSYIDPILSEIDGLDYTTRMEFPMFTNVSQTSPMGTSIVGIHTKTEGNIQSDSTYGTNILVEKNATYLGNSMEELLNTTENVCVVDQDFVDTQILSGDSGFGIGSEIKVFPHDSFSTSYPILPSDTNTIIGLNNGTSETGLITSLNTSDNVNYTLISQNGMLSANISISTFPFTFNNPKPIQFVIESRTNNSLENLEIQAFNFYTNQFEPLGTIDSITETNKSFQFHPERMYINPMSSMLELRIFGNNSDLTGEYKLEIDSLHVDFIYSKHSLIDQSTWPSYEVIGIIEVSKLYNTERYFWPAGYEVYLSSVSNGIYLNYETARDQIFVDYKGLDISTDFITSLLIHCNEVANISEIQSSLTQDLIAITGDQWTIADTKTLQYEFRNMVLVWYIWLDEGIDQEETLKYIQTSLEEDGIVIFFGFTWDFAKSTFSTMIDLMTFIMYGMLILSILISLIGLALHCLLTTMSRRREIGMLRSIGLSKEGVIRSISGETLVIALIGVVIGIIAGLLQGSLSVLSLPEGGFLTITFVIPWLTISILILITILAAIGSSMLPSRWAANINIIDAVRTR